MDIEFKDGAVCFDGNEQWFTSIEDGQLISACGSYGAYYDDLIGNDSFQLNTIKRGDYFFKSDFDTKDKYNIASNVFKLFGFANLWSYEEILSDSEGYNLLVVDEDGQVDGCSDKYFGCERRLTFDQLVTIGKLKYIEEMSLLEDLLKDSETSPQKDF